MARMTIGNTIVRFRWWILAVGLVGAVLLGLFVQKVDPSVNELSSFLPPDTRYSQAVRAMQNGAAAFLEKPVSDDELVDLVQRSLAENTKIRAKREKLQFTHDRIAKLSKRERETMWMVVDGLTSRQIAAQLGISAKTVEVHRARVMEKMPADNVPHLIHILQAARPEEPNSF